MKIKIINKDLLHVFKDNKLIAEVYRLTRDCPVCVHVPGVDLPMEVWHSINDTAREFFAETM